MSEKSVYKIKDKCFSKDGNEEYLVECKSSDKTAEEWKKSKDIEDFENLIQQFNRQSTPKITNGLTNDTNGLSNGTDGLPNGTVNGTHEDVLRSVVKSAQKPNGFDRGFHPFKILGAKNDDQNGLMFLVMFREDMTSADLIPNHILHEKCPQLLIKFYEKNTLWKRY